MTGRETDPRVRRLRATAHPIRLRILSLLTGAELSAAEVARELGLTQANASYHLRRLLDAGEVVVAGEERIRGGVAKRYRHPWRRVAEDAAAESDAAVSLPAHLRAMAEEMVRRHELRAGGTRRVYCDAELWVTDDDWAEVVGLVEQAAHLLHERARPPRTEGTRPVALTIAAFAMQGPAADAPTPSDP